MASGYLFRTLDFFTLVTLIHLLPSWHTEREADREHSFTKGGTFRRTVGLAILVTGSVMFNFTTNTTIL